VAVAADNHAVAWLDEWTQVLEDCPLDRGRAEIHAWLDTHGVSEPDRDRVVRIEIVKTANGDVLRLLVRSDYLRSRGLEDKAL